MNRLRIKFRKQFYRLSTITFCLLALMISISTIESTAEARTIVLVYDDSGSMEHDPENKKTKYFKWAYANYAAQSLATLLRKDDRLSAVRMSSPSKEEKLDTDKAINVTLQTIKNKWHYSGRTPYKSIQTAMKIISDSIAQRETQSDKAAVSRKKEKDWLIVTTDGKFKGNPDEQEINNLLRMAAGRIQIIFLLIGKNAGKDIPQLWADLAPKQVEIFKATNEIEIINEMEIIAARINGRDDEMIEIAKNDRKIGITSPFPIRRITVFEQVTTASLSIVDKK